VEATAEGKGSIQMKRQINRLTAAQVRTAQRDMCDGAGLWLQFDPKHETRSWLYRYTCPIYRKADSMGFGSTMLTSLARARELRQEAYEIRRQGLNPRLERDAKIERRRIEAAKAAAIPTFLQCADMFIDAKAIEWTNLKHADQWRRSFHGPEGEPAPTARLNSLPVDAINTPLVLACLEPLWKSTPVTASRIRGRIENILDFARAKGWRAGDNPAARGLIEYALPRASKAPKEHHAALAYTDIRVFMRELRAKEGVAARHLEFIILTATRLGEALHARWDEFDLEARVWTIPAQRMKARKAHRVPLSARAIDILKSLRSVGVFLFPGTRAGQAMSERPMRNVLAELRPDITVHGFRSSFRDWAGDETTFPREVAEAALAHRLGDSAELSYRRGDALERRRKLMDAWAAYCEGEPSTGAEVIPLRAAR
jgi:integrase